MAGEPTYADSTKTLADHAIYASSLKTHSQPIPRDKMPPYYTDTHRAPAAGYCIRWYPLTIWTTLMEKLPMKTPQTMLTSLTSSSKAGRCKMKSHGGTTAAREQTATLKAGVTRETPTDTKTPLRQRRRGRITPATKTRKRKHLHAASEQAHLRLPNPFPLPLQRW